MSKTLTGVEEMQYAVHTRSQHAKRGRSGFCGPDAYVAVTVAENGVAVPYVLNQNVLTKRGIEIFYFGTGYSRYTGSKSQLGKALAAAETFVRERQAIQRLIEKNSSIAA